MVSEIKQLGKSSGVTTLLRKPAPMALTTIAKPAGTTIAPQQLQKRALGELKMVVSPGATVVRPSVVKDKLGVVQTMQAVQQEALKSVAMREIRAKF